MCRDICSLLVLSFLVHAFCSRKTLLSIHIGLLVLCAQSALEENPSDSNSLPPSLRIPVPAEIEITQLSYSGLIRTPNTGWLTLRFLTGARSSAFYFAGNLMAEFASYSDAEGYQSV